MPKLRGREGPHSPLEAPALAKLPSGGRNKPHPLPMALPLQEPQPNDALVPCFLLSWKPGLADVPTGRPGAAAT